MPAPDKFRSADLELQSRLRWLRRFGFLLLAVVLLLSGLIAEDRLRRQIEPDLTGLAGLIADDLAQQVARAVEAGVPAERLVGMSAFFDSALVADERVRAAALIDATGRLLHGHDPDALLADLLPGDLPREGHRVAGYRLVVLQPLLLPEAAAGDQPALRVLIAADIGLLASSSAKLWGSLLLLGIALTIAGTVLLNALLDLVWYQPRALLRSVAEAVQDGDFALSLPPAPGELGRVVTQVEERLKAANTAYLALRLAAFGTRAGNFEPSVLKSLRAAERHAIEGLRFAAERGTRRLQSSEGGLSAAASFLLLLPEAILIGAGDASAASSFDDLLAILAGAGLVLLLRRLLISLLPRQLAYAFGALLAAFCLMLALFLPPPLDWVARLGSGAGYGLAFLAVCQSRSGAASLPKSLLAALACGLAAGLFLDSVLAADWAVAMGLERGTAILSVALLLLAALLGGATLQASAGQTKDVPGVAVGAVHGLLCATAAGLLLPSAWHAEPSSSQIALSVLPPLVLALPLAWFLLSAFPAAPAASPARLARTTTAASVLTVVLLAVATFGEALELEQIVPRVAMAASVALLLLIPALASEVEEGTEDGRSGSGATTFALALLAFALGLLAALAVLTVFEVSGDASAAFAAFALLLALVAAGLGVRRGLAGPVQPERAP